MPPECQCGADEWIAWERVDGQSVIMRVGRVGKKVQHCPHPVLASCAPAPGPQDPPQPLSRNGTELPFCFKTPSLHCPSQEMGTTVPFSFWQMNQSVASLGGDRLTLADLSNADKSCGVLQGLSERMAKVKRFLWTLNFTKS